MQYFIYATKCCARVHVFVSHDLHTHLWSQCGQVVDCISVSSQLQQMQC
jgi:hypothetical protein